MGLSPRQRGALQRLAGERFPHEWMLGEALGRLNAQWRPLGSAAAGGGGAEFLQRKLDYLHRLFAVPGPDAAPGPWVGLTRRPSLP